MPSSKQTYDPPSPPPSLGVKEEQVEYGFIGNPSIGVLLCRDKDDEVVEYALSRNLSPALVAQYQLQLPDKKLIAARMHELLTGHEGVGDE